MAYLTTVMRVYVNDTEIIIFEGATVQDALNKYALQVLNNCRFKERADGSCGRTGKTVHDSHGNPVMTGGSLAENDRIFWKIDTDKMNHEQ